MEGCGKWFDRDQYRCEGSTLCPECLSKLKQGCGKEFIFYDNDVTCGDDFEYEGEVKVILCEECSTKGGLRNGAER